MFCKRLTYITLIFNHKVAICANLGKTIFANFRNCSKGIFGNHLTAKDCQNVKFCDIVEI